MWLKKLFGIKTVSTKQVKKEEIKNEDSIQFGPEKTLLKTSGFIQRQLWKTKERNPVIDMYG